MAITRELDPSLFKDVIASRGIKYHYFFSPAEASRPTLLLCHGFPSTSREWRHVIPYLQTKGYGVLAPDMLGYGGTDKPTDPAAYVSSLVTKDIVDLLDAEKLDKVVAIGFDWYVSACRVLLVIERLIHGYQGQQGRFSTCELVP